jgi:hypothetical protein
MLTRRFRRNPSSRARKSGDGQKSRSRKRNSLRNDYPSRSLNLLQSWRGRICECLRRCSGAISCFLQENAFVGSLILLSKFRQVSFDENIGWSDEGEKKEWSVFVANEAPARITTEPLLSLLMMAFSCAAGLNVARADRNSDWLSLSCGAASPFTTGSKQSFQRPLSFLYCPSMNPSFLHSLSILWQAGLPSAAA